MFLLHLISISLRPILHSICSPVLHRLLIEFMDLVFFCTTTNMTSLLSIFVLVRFPPVLLLLFSILSSTFLLLQALSFLETLLLSFSVICFTFSPSLFLMQPWNTVNKSDSLSAPAFAVVVWSLVFPSTYLTRDIPFETPQTSDRHDHGALRLL